jgi:sulfur carrier protein ThiS
MRVLFLNNDGGGFAQHMEVAEGTVLLDFFQKQFPNREPGDYLIRVNRQPASSDQVLQDNDRITVTPTRIEGAA